MRVQDDDTLNLNPGARRKYEAVRNEVMEMHLFDAEAAEEEALCGEDSLSIVRMSVGYYLEARRRGRPRRDSLREVQGSCDTARMEYYP